jgi:hypothetical protein
MQIHANCATTSSSDSQSNKHPLSNDPADESSRYAIKSMRDIKFARKRFVYDNALRVTAAVAMLRGGGVCMRAALSRMHVHSSFSVAQIRWSAVAHTTATHWMHACGRRGRHGGCVPIDGGCGDAAREGQMAGARRPRSHTRCLCSALLSLACNCASWARA